jgi:hypothetical protein
MHSQMQQFMNSTPDAIHEVEEDAQDSLSELLFLSSFFVSGRVCVCVCWCCVSSSAVFALPAFWGLAVSTRTSLPAGWWRFFPVSLSSESLGNGDKASSSGIIKCKKHPTYASANCNALLKHVLDTFGRLLGHLLDTCWRLFGHLLDTCWTIL